MANLLEVNNRFLDTSMVRNYGMASYPITQPGQIIDIELDSVPGYAAAIDLMCYFDIAVTAGATPAAPTMSQFAPYNFFREVQISLGGGPFQDVMPYAYYLRELAMHAGWDPSKSALAPAYAASTLYNTPNPTVTASSTTDNFYRFPLRIPLQTQHGSILGHIPMGSAAIKVKVRLTVASSFYGNDQYYNAFSGGTNVTGVTVGTNQQSWVQPNIIYRTTPAGSDDKSIPHVGYLLNMQEKSVNFTAAGVNTPIRFGMPFKYMRLWLIVIDGTGAPNTTGVINLELDPAPGYPQFRYGSAQEIMQYLYTVRRRYQTDLPTGVFCFDLWAGSDPQNPNDTQVLDGSVFSTLQCQLSVSSGTNVASPARIIAFSEALSPVNF